MGLRQSLWFDRRRCQSRACRCGHLWRAAGQLRAILDVPQAACRRHLRRRGRALPGLCRDVGGVLVASCRWLGREACAQDRPVPSGEGAEARRRRGRRRSPAAGGGSALCRRRGRCGAAAAVEARRVVPIAGSWRQRVAPVLGCCGCFRLLHLFGEAHGRGLVVFEVGRFASPGAAPGGSLRRPRVRAWALLEAHAGGRRCWGDSVGKALAASPAWHHSCGAHLGGPHS
mmetsp:Transcript_17322/g.47939  ORF Transcript_17322/g.47939 Transcript_17322/m.47939 type:complete len:229 (+) Transcript_17322:723-1409(+)